MKKKLEELTAAIRRPSPTDAEMKSSPPPLDRMVRVRNVCTRAITEAGNTYKPGDEFDLTPQRADEYKQRVRIVRR